MNRDEKERRKRLRKGESVPGVWTGELRESCRSALEASWTLARTRPDEVAWVYRFAIEWDKGTTGPDISWTGVRFSREPEKEVMDEGRRIILTPIIGYKNGEKVSPKACTTVHGLNHTKKVPVPNPFYPPELVDRWKEYARKLNGRG